MICNIKRKPMTRLQLGHLRGHDFIPGRCKSQFSSCKHLDQLCGPSYLPVNGYWVQFSLRVQWLGHDADNLSAHNARVKNEWRCSCIPPYSFIMHRSNFTYLKPIKVSQLFLSLNQEAPWWLLSYCRLKYGDL
jgi:hypothetical protein